MVFVTSQPACTRELGTTLTAIFAQRFTELTIRLRNCTYSHGVFGGEHWVQLHDTLN